jgi:hypothetical protein
MSDRNDEAAKQLTRQRWEGLVRAAADPEVPSCGVEVMAVILDAVNRLTRRTPRGTATVSRISARTGLSGRHVRRMRQLLVARGHLRCEAINGVPSVFWIPPTGDTGDPGHAATEATGDPATEDTGGPHIRPDTLEDLPLRKRTPKKRSARTEGASRTGGAKSHSAEFAESDGGPPMRGNDHNDEDAADGARDAAGSPGAEGATCANGNGDRAAAADEGAANGAPGNGDGGGRLPFTPDVIRRIVGLGVDLGPLLVKFERYRAKTEAAGKRIADPSAYFLAMAQDEAAKAAGVSRDTIKRVNGGTHEDRARAWAGAVGIGAEPRPEYIERFKQRLRIRRVDPEERLEAWRKSREGRQPFASQFAAEADLDRFDMAREFATRH